MQRPQRNRKAPVPLYVPDADQVMEDDYSDEGSDEDDDGESIDSSDTDVSYSGSEPNEYQYDDFVVPDDASLSMEGEQGEEEDDEASFSGSEESGDSDDQDEGDQDGGDDSDGPAAEGAGMSEAAD